MPMNSFNLRSLLGLDDLEETSQPLNLHPESETSNTDPNSKNQNTATQSTVELNPLSKDWKDKGIGKHASTRYNVNFHILIFNHKKSFRTHTENVSLTGILLADTIPQEFAKGQFDIILIQDRDPNHKKHVLFRGELVTNQKENRRVFFKSASENSVSALYSLIDDYVQNPVVNTK